MTGPPGQIMNEGTAHFFPPRVAVPYTSGKLRAETADAVASFDVRVQLLKLSERDPYAYGNWLAANWNTGGDLIVVEHDMVPTWMQARRMLTCEADWCGHPYHVGEGRYTTGLGFCKFSHNLQRRRPLAGERAARSTSTRGGLVPWQGLNESIERVLTRWGERMHVHEGAIEHLHYPEVPDAR